MGKFNVVIKESAFKKLRSFPLPIQKRIQDAITTYLPNKPYLANGKHIKKLLEGYRLRVGDYRIFYYIDGDKVIITSIVRRTSTTY